MHNINRQVPLHDQHGYSESDGATYFLLIYYDNIFVIFINSKRNDYMRRFADLFLRLVFIFLQMYYYFDIFISKFFFSP